MRLVVPPGVFRPRSDSLHLAEAAAVTVAPGQEVLDLCSGSGVVALTAARVGGAVVVAVDVSPLAVVTVRANAALRRLPVTTKRGDLFSPVAGRRFDLITANPPYLPDVDGALRPSRFRVGQALAVNGGPDGRAMIDRVISGAPSHLKPGGSLLLVQSSVCGLGATEDAMQRAGLRPAVVRRHRGPLGPLLSARADALRAAGKLSEPFEEILVIRGTLE